MYNASAMLLRGANLSDILNPTIARQNLGISTGTLTPGIGLTGGLYNGVANSSIAVNASLDGLTASTSNTMIAQYDVAGSLTANALTASNLTLGSFTTSPLLKIGGTGTIQCSSGGAGNLLINSTSSGVIGINSNAGAISMSALSGQELYATGSKTITAGTGTTVNLYTGSFAQYALIVNGGLNSIGRINCTGGLTADVLTSPTANLITITATTATTGNLNATNATLTSLTSNSVTSTNVAVTTALLVGGVTTLNSQGVSGTTALKVTAPSVVQVSTTGSSVALALGSSAVQALTVSSGLLCNLTSGYGLASNALTVTGGAVIDVVSNVPRFPQYPSFAYQVITPNGAGSQTINCPLIQYYVTPPIGIDPTNISNGKITFDYTGRYMFTLNLNNLSGTGNWVNCYINRVGAIYNLFGTQGSTIQLSGSFTTVFDIQVGDFIQLSTYGVCSFDRLAITGYMIS